MKRIVICLHKMIYPLLVRGFKNMRKHEFVYVNALPDIKENAIYAVNHSCKFDIPYVCELIARQAYVLVGKQPLKAIDRIAFYLNGTVWVDRKSKSDKKKATAKMIALLKNGSDLIMFPEGTWNLTPSSPMLPLYWGIIDIARYAEKPIIPVVLEYTNKKCYVSFGQRMDIIPTDDKAEKIDELKDQFATMKWEIWERFSDTGYDTEMDWNNEVKKRIQEYPKLDIEYENSVIRNAIYRIE